MKFGPVPVAEAAGGIAVHSIRKGGVVLKKGTVIGSAPLPARAPTAASSSGTSTCPRASIRSSTGKRSRRGTVHDNGLAAFVAAFHLPVLLPQDALDV